MLFGLSHHGHLYFRTSEANAPWVPLAGSPCGVVWGTPVDVDASSRGIWVVCKKEFATASGIRKEHFLFAKWGWSPENNHPWWHMMSSGNVSQLDADKDSMFGVDHTGAVLWRPAGGVNRHSRWHRFDGPPGAKMREILADSDASGTWLWGRDTEGRLWRRRPDSDAARAGDTLWSLEDEDGIRFWPQEGPEIATIKNGGGLNWAVDTSGRVFWRPIQGCCVGADGGPANESGVPACWCLDYDAPRLSQISDFGDHGIGRELPALFQRNAEQEGGWAPKPHRYVSQLTSRMDGATQKRRDTAPAFYADGCAAPASGFDHCSALESSIREFTEDWRLKSHQEWNTWDWHELKESYWRCQGKPEDCEAPLKHFGAFREQFLQHAFCCARNQLTEDDLDCTGSSCGSYDMVCPGSTLPSSDRDCTVYHSSDPGAQILLMKKVANEVLGQVVNSPRATLQVVFDANLFGTWTWIPDRVFQRFSWPTSSKALFEPVDSDSGQTVWVFRKKCTAGTLKASLARFREVMSGQLVHSQAEEDLSHREHLRRLTANFAEGAYSAGSMEDWERIFSDFGQVASRQKAGYLTYPTLLDIVGRRQAGIFAEFSEDAACAQQVSFVEQATFLASNAMELPSTVRGDMLQEVVSRFLMQNGKYFDRMLDANMEAEEAGSTLLRTLENIHGDTGSDRSSQRWSPQSDRQMGGSISHGETRVASCLDVAMWSTAMRHMEAFRTDAGELGRPMVEAFFACFAEPDAAFDAAGGVALRSSVLTSLQDWVGSLAELSPPPCEAASSTVIAVVQALACSLAAALAMASRRGRRRASCRLPVP